MDESPNRVHGCAPDWGSLARSCTSWMCTSDGGSVGGKGLGPGPDAAMASVPGWASQQPSREHPASRRQKDHCSCTRSNPRMCVRNASSTQVRRSRKDKSWEKVW